MDVVIAQGEDARARLQDPLFRSQYQQLFSACSWATAFQDLGFIETWFAVYGDRYTPVVVSAHDGEALTGVLVLGRSQQGGLTVAGAHQAEYQGWLSRDDEFIVQALRAVRESFPAQDLTFRFLPQGIPTSAIDAHAQLARAVRWESVPHAFIDTQTPAVKNWFRSKKKHKVNSLNRIAPLRFERIETRARLAEKLERMASICDLRQGLANGIVPFTDDPRKGAFHLALFDKPGLDVATLSVGDELIAFNLGMRSRDRVHLGVFAQTVWHRYAKYSPGELLVMMLAQALAAQDVPLLDLTPGGDGYKAALATRTESARVLQVYARASQCARAKLMVFVRSGVKRALQAAAPALVQPALRARVTRAMQMQPMGEWRLHGAGASAAIELRENQIADLRLALTGGRELRRQLLRQAVGAMDRGATLFTLVRGQRILGVALLGADPSSNVWRLEVAWLMPDRALIDEQAKWLRAVVQRSRGDIHLRSARFGFVATVLRRAFGGCARAAMRWRPAPQA